MIYFFNTFHNGDIHYSKPFVKDIMGKLGNNEYCYLHNNHPSILKDIPNIKQDKAFKSFDNWKLVTDYPIHYNKQVIRNGDDIYINTWVGQLKWITSKGVNRNRNNRYCSLYSHYELYQDIYNNLNIPINPIEDYIPEINFNYIEKENIDMFINNINYENIILLVNNDPLTVRISVDMINVVSKLSKENPTTLFILTKKDKLVRDNVIYTEDIIKMNRDLNEISYLSLFCNIIVGRPSGPYVYTMIKDNFIQNKTFITISNNTYDMYFFENNANMELLLNHTEKGLIDMIKMNLI